MINNACYCPFITMPQVNIFLLPVIFFVLENDLLLNLIITTMGLLFKKNLVNGLFLFSTLSFFEKSQTHDISHEKLIIRCYDKLHAKHSLNLTNYQMPICF
jgi:hypothetical protein